MKGFARVRTKSRILETFGITNHALIAPEFLAHDGLIMLHYKPIHL